MANKGFKSLVESPPEFSNQNLENSINDIKSIDNDDGYMFILSQFAMDTAIHDNTVLTQTQKNDALETLYNAQPHLQIGRYLSDVIRHTNTILDGTIVYRANPDVEEVATFLEILSTVQSLQTTIPMLYGGTAADKSRSVNDHLGSLNNIFIETEDSSKPVFTRLKETLQLIENNARTTNVLAVASAAVRYANSQVVTFLTTIVDDSTDFQTTLNNRINTAAGNMANLNTRISAIPGDPTVDLIAIREEINTQVNLENSNLSGIRNFITTLTNNMGYTSLADDPDLRKLITKVSRNVSWKTYFNDYEKNQSYINPLYNTVEDSDKEAVITRLTEQRGLYNVTDFIDLDAVANKAVNGNDYGIDSKDFDLYTIETVIEKCCEQLKINTANNTVYQQSELLLNHLNQRDREILAEAIDRNEDANTLS